MAEKNNASAVPPGSTAVGMRLNKFVAHCGICSRRKAAEHIKNGDVQLNGEVYTDPSYQVQEGDVIQFKGKAILPKEKMVYFLMNKPKNTITTLSDERGRPTVLDLVKGKIEERVFPVGRLDRNTTGLLLLTNDGDLAMKMTHPSYEMKKVYEATLDKPIAAEHLDTILNGFELEDGPAKADAIHFLDKSQMRVSIALHIGRNRIVRRIFSHFGSEVIKLDRVYLGGLTKKDLPRGFIRPLTPQEVIMLKHFTGKR